MKQLTYLAFIAITAFSIVSCTKVIDVNLSKSDPKVVIEANITDTIGPNMVRITKTTDIDKDNNFPNVTGAYVTITDDAGNQELLKETTPGTYVTSTTVGMPGRTYTLTVVADGQTYTAVSTMPQKVAYDSLGLKDVTTFDGPVPYPTVYYRDPVGLGNYYRAIRYVNNVYDGQTYVESDELIDGKAREAILFGGPDDEEELLPTDIVTVEMQCIDKQMYEYLLELQEVDGGSEVATPANPISNISNGAVGYFSAHTSEVKVLALP